MGMKVNYKTKGNDFPNMIKRLKAIDGTGVDVGVLNGEHKWLASIHEYGCDIAVTDKMRVFLHSQGLHLKATTTHIHIPERSSYAPAMTRMRKGKTEDKPDAC